MKRLVLTLSLVLSFLSMRASHLMGGEIVAQQLNDSSYLVTLTYYRDTLGIPLNYAEYLNVYDASGAQVGTYLLPMDSSTFSVLPNSCYGVQMASYSDTVVFQPGFYTLQAATCCRNYAVATISGLGMSLQTNLTVFAPGVVNSSPAFLATPIVCVPLMQVFQYAPMPYDADGDSLAWYLGVPNESYNVPCASYQIPPSDASLPLSIDPFTGVVSWMANTLGNFNITIVADEYRNGVLIGQITRDMQFIVTPNGNKVAQFTNLSDIPTDGNGTHRIIAEVGSPLTFSLLAIDEDVQDEVFMSAFGACYGKGANLHVAATGNGNEKKGDFSWVPSLEDMGTNLVGFRVSDGFYSFDEVIIVEVLQSVANEQSDLGLRLMPNPVNTILTVESPSTIVSIELFDMLGNKVLSQKEAQVDMSKLATGIYSVRVQTEAGILTQKIQKN